MLSAHSGVAAAETVIAPSHAEIHAVWIDLFDPTEAERALAERATGLRIPSRADIEEIESSSRLSAAGGVLTLNMSMSFRDAEGSPVSTPLGFVLSEQRLVTVRYAKLPVFETFAGDLAHGDGNAPCSAEVFVRLLEALVDRLADVLERVGRDMDELSRDIFRTPVTGTRQTRADKAMLTTLRSVGRAGDGLANVRTALLGIGRMAPYVAEIGQGFIPLGLQQRFMVVERDIASLNDFDTQLNAKVNLLLDATLGFINIEQNNGIKVLTIVSIIGIPPTFIASLYGMNFKYMPELQWVWGYPVALALMLITGLAPLVWFKIKGWL